VHEHKLFVEEMQVGFSYSLACVMDGSNEMGRWREDKSLSRFVILCWRLLTFLSFFVVSIAEGKGWYCRSEGASRAAAARGNQETGGSAEGD